MTNDDDRPVEEIRRPLRARRAAATVLFHRLNGDNRQGVGAGIEQALRECAAYSDEHLTPATVVLWPALDILNFYLDTLGTDARENLLTALRGEMTRYAVISGPPEPEEPQQ